MSVKERDMRGLESHEPDSVVLAATTLDPENLDALPLSEAT